MNIHRPSLSSNRAVSKRCCGESGSGLRTVAVAASVLVEEHEGRYDMVLLESLMGVSSSLVILLCACMISGYLLLVADFLFESSSALTLPSILARRRPRSRVSSFCV